MATLETLKSQLIDFDDMYVTVELQKENLISVLVTIQCDGEIDTERFDVTETKDGLHAAYVYICNEASSFMCEEDYELLNELLLTKDQGFHAALAAHM